MLGGFLKENKGVDQQKKLRGTMEDSSNRTRGSTAKNHFGKHPNASQRLFCGRATWRLVIV